MRIFFTTPYNGKKMYQGSIDAILSIVESTGATVISPEKQREYNDAFRRENLKQLGDPERVHYEFIRQGIANADAVIIEASYEDFRVGHEATLAIIYNKPVLCLSRLKDYGKLIRHEKFRGVLYTDVNLKDTVLTFLNEISYKLLSSRRGVQSSTLPLNSESQSIS
ncbi:MAG: hypothetical protein Q7S76_03640, partial [bacterium]|nr:hypothetical protein [bacterium]